MLTITEDFNQIRTNVKDHLIKNKDYYMLGGGALAGGLGLHYLVNRPKMWRGFSGSTAENDISKLPGIRGNVNTIAQNSGMNDKLSFNRGNIPQVNYTPVDSDSSVTSLSNSVHGNLSTGKFFDTHGLENSMDDI